MKYISLLILITFMSSGAQALNICLHARSTKDVISGHAFVTVQNDSGSIQETYGMWPNDKLTKDHPRQVAINRPGDLPSEVMRARGYIIANDSPNMTEEVICTTLKVKIKILRDAALTYTNEDVYGPYQTFNNNCTHFAIRLFNFGGQQDFPVVASPKRTKAIIVRSTN